MAGYTALTFADLKTRLAARYESVPFWSATEAGNAINEGLLTYGMLTGRWKRRIALATSPMDYELGLPDTMVYRMRVTFDGQPLSPTTLFDLDHGRPNWRKETTASGGAVPTRPTLWAPISLMLIYVWPMVTTVPHSWGLDGVSATPTLVDDADTVDLAEADVSVLLGFALHVLTYKKGGPWFAATLPYYQQFLRAAGEENSRITTSQFYRRAMGNDPSLAPIIGIPTAVSRLVPQGQG